jgi:nucleoside-diphosphate-sugar epimerase
MVIGTGMLAKAFSSYADNNEYLVFASGVSNSLETRDIEFQREKILLTRVINANPAKTLIYFSTCSMYDPATKGSVYLNHKLELEKLTASLAKKYYIFRISQIVGKTNNTTLINFLVNKIRSNELFEVWKNSSRNIIAIDDVYTIINYILQNKILANQVINIANPISMPILDIIGIIEVILASTGNYCLVERGFPYEKIDLGAIQSILNKFEIFFAPEYYYNAIKKYYSES